MDDMNEKLRKDILIRLRRIEGQVKGIQGMVEKKVCCKDVLVQIAAIRAATNKVGSMLIENYARNCIGIEEGTLQSEGLEELIKTINTFMK
ncbi:metal-sensitive transcriptional regulator [Clostridium fallax]|uniref:DNA-binding transcriptional regulator, FrmR family n=1 Tax=Clostridium fallax TaxID=1533 RepID=A0A1M4ZHZ6_9CLOT|nr:metal-sensitive transcriptional regulator [Clostridium fallax]SHF17206.1 DNA-binding transcriptional regulator, FrmR family [Clostridium fallax]SQB06191.1 Copper-sensitive operon repressor [Clostridium fallax]